MAIKYTAECQICSVGDASGPMLYDDEDERDEEAQTHANRTGHRLAVGWIDTNEHNQQEK